MRYTIADLIAAAEAIDAVERLKADLAEFAADFLDFAGPDAGVVDFLDISTGDAFNLPPVEAEAYFRGKGLRPTFSYADMMGVANDQAFTVAKMMDVDLLKQVRDSLEGALANGVPFNQWKREITGLLQSAGWWGKAPVIDPQTGQAVTAQLGSAWRLETIFRTNLQTAYAAGQWQQIEGQADVAPFLMYDAIDDFRTRPAHRSWDGTVLPVTSAWWKTHYPPNGYNCRCGVIQLSEDQLQRLGISPRPQPPEDGTYSWRNPRTGQTIDVPNGVDPGFDRNAGSRGLAELRKVLNEKVTALPRDMREAVAPTLRRQFDASTDAGKWHVVSFEGAPDWIRNKVLDLQAVRVETRASTAHAQLGSKIDMDGEKIDTGAGQSIWRHEFGHIMDARLATKALYRSYHSDFVNAQKSDAERLTVAAGNGRKSKANDAARAEVVQAYEDARTRMIDAGAGGRVELLREMAAAAGIDFDSFVQVLRKSTFVIAERSELTQVGEAVRVARMLEAIRLRDGEGFLRFATFRDAFEAELAAGRVTPETRQLKNESWEKDGSLAALSDLIGSATRNKAANHKKGFFGHSDAYYRRSVFNAPTESFANLTAMSGHPNSAGWWPIVRKLTPAMAELFEDILKGQA